MTNCRCYSLHCAQSISSHTSIPTVFHECIFDLPNIAWHFTLWSYDPFPNYVNLMYIIKVLCPPNMYHTKLSCTLIIYITRQLQVCLCRWVFPITYAERVLSKFDHAFRKFHLKLKCVCYECMLAINVIALFDSEVCCGTC